MKDEDMPFYIGIACLIIVFLFLFMHFSYTWGKQDLCFESGGVLIDGICKDLEVVYACEDTTGNYKKVKYLINISLD